MSQKGSRKAHYTESWLTTGRISPVSMSSALSGFVDHFDMLWNGLWIVSSIVVIPSVGLPEYAVKAVKKRGSDHFLAKREDFAPHVRDGSPRNGVFSLCKNSLNLFSTDILFSQYRKSYVPIFGMTGN